MSNAKKARRGPVATLGRDNPAGLQGLNRATMPAREPRTMTTSAADSPAVGVPVERGVGRPVPKRKPGPRRYVVDDRRNSVSAVPLNRLDWMNWFTDGTSRGLYLHVWSKDGETCHRVFCRHSDTPRLSCDGGLLRWLVDDHKTANVEVEAPLTAPRR